MTQFRDADAVGATRKWRWWAFRDAACEGGRQDHITILEGDDIDGRVHGRALRGTAADTAPGFQLICGRDRESLSFAPPVDFG